MITSASGLNFRPQSKLLRYLYLEIAYHINRLNYGSGPQQIQIETLNTCTRKCWFCKFSQVRQDQLEVSMPQKTFEHLVSQLERLDFKGRISLYGINEPLMDPMLTARVRALRDACPRAYLTIDTNGDLLSHAAIADLEAAGLDSIIVNAYDTPALRRMSKFADAPIVSLRDSRNKDDEVENRGGSILRKSHLFDTKKVADRCGLWQCDGLRSSRYLAF